MDLTATISRITESDNFPKTLQDWIVPAAAATALVVGVNLVVKSTKQTDGNRPPVVRSWIPWVGSDWDIERDPDAFFERVSKEHPGGIFAVKTNGWTYHFITAAPLINEVHKKPKVFSMALPQADWGRNIWLHSDFVIENQLELINPHTHRYLSPAYMMSLLERFDEQAAAYAKTVAIPGDSTSLREFIMKFAYRTTGIAYFGEQFDYEGTYEDFDGLDEKVWRVALGYPPWMLRRFYRSRANLIKKFTKWVYAPHEASEMITGLERIFRAAGLEGEDLGGMMVGFWWPLMANVPWGSVWLLLLQLQRAEGVKPIIDELDAAGAAWIAANPEFKAPYTDHLTEFFKSQPHTPLFSSTISEVLRYATDSYSMRGVIVEDTVLGGYTMKKGDTVICRTRSVHRDPKEFERANEFVPDRFVDGEGGKGTEGAFKWMPFGGGSSMCSGRHFAQFHVRVLLTTLLKNFKFEVDYSKSDLPIRFSNTNRGFGLRRPQGDLAVKITRLEK